MEFQIFIFMEKNQMFEVLFFPYINANQNSIKANLSSIKKTRPELVKHCTQVISSGIIRLHRRLQHTQVRNEPARHGQASC